LQKKLVRYDCSLQALVDLTIEQFLACNCVGLELHTLGLWTRRFEDGRAILAPSAAQQLMPWRACCLVEQWVQPAVVVACVCAVTAARKRPRETRPRGRKTGEMPSWQSQLSLFEGTGLQQD
jgi:hypothetical protein